MSDIFISYKREEQAEARKLANALEREGWTVWWDPKLRAGEHFDDVIEAALIDSRCAVVMWSCLSVQSRYVKDEATYALNHKKLVPVAVEVVEPPLRFAGIQTPQLIGWDGSDDFAAYRKLREVIMAILGPSPASLKAEEEARCQADEKERMKAEAEAKRQVLEKERLRIEADLAMLAEEEEFRNYGEVGTQPGGKMLIPDTVAKRHAVGKDRKQIESQSGKTDANRISYSVIIAAVLIGSSIIVNSDKGPKLYGFPFLGFIGYVAASIIGLWLVISIIRSGKL